MVLTGAARRERLKLLLDSNVFIAVEPYAGAVEPGVAIAARLVRLANEQGHLLCVAPATRDDLLQGRDPARRAQRLVELEKFHLLNEVPIDSGLVALAGNSNPGTNDHRDLRLLAALRAGAATHLVTEDDRLRRRARRAKLGEAVLTIADAVELLTGFAPVEAQPPPRVGRVPTYTLDTEQAIFDGLRRDYAEFDEWLTKVRADSDNRTCYVVQEGETYAAIALLKAEPDCCYSLPQPIVKISTFKVDTAHAGVKFGELLLKAVLIEASASQVGSLYVEVLPTHPEVIEFLTDFGFCDSGERTARDELVYVKRLMPGPEAEGLADLDYHIQYGPPALRPTQDMYVVPIRPEWHDQLFPEKAPPPHDSTQLSLFAEAEPPLTHPWGNALRKAYLCSAPITTIAPGDLLLFYRSRDARAVTVLGIVEDVLRSRQPEEVLTFVGRRTVYTPDEIARMCRSVRGVLALRFRQDRFMEPPWQLSELRLAGVLKSWPQTISASPKRGKEWVRQQLTE